jgi:hypothetical protein
VAKTTTPKNYVGRLAFDPDSGFHLSEDGKPVITEDKGKSWRYAAEGEPNHLSRYQRRVVVIDTTANAEDPEPHHFEVQPDDPHVDGVLVDPDVEAETITAHTEAWKDSADE